jgi:hypothetical protein
MDKDNAERAEVCQLSLEEMSAEVAASGRAPSALTATDDHRYRRPNTRARARPL